MNSIEIHGIPAELWELAVSLDWIVAHAKRGNIELMLLRMETLRKQIDHTYWELLPDDEKKRRLDKLDEEARKVYGQ